LEGKKRLEERLQAESDKKNAPVVIKEEDLPEADVPESVETKDAEHDESA
jgi:hypothetical protein